MTFRKRASSLIAVLLLASSLVVVTNATNAATANAATLPIQLAIGTANGCVLDGGQTQCWGTNDAGQLGNNGTNTSAIPVNVMQGGVSYIAIAAGQYTVCGLTSAGQAYCWGLNANGRAGSGNSTYNYTTPNAVNQGAVTFTSITASAANTCGLTSAGQTYCWGSGGFGQNGNNSTADQLSPVAVSQGGIVYTSIYGAGNSDCGLTAAGQTYCWGANYSGQLGNGSTSTSLTPVAVTQGGVTFASIAVGNAHACGLTAAGAMYCWGNNGYGQLGNNSYTDSSTMVAVQQGGVVFTSMALSNGTTCALVAAGNAYCWGNNTTGQVGDGTITNRTTPVTVSGGLTFAKLAGGQTSNNECGITSTNRVYCWGTRYGGRLADNAMPTIQYSPKPVNQSALLFTSIVAGGETTCALTAAGQTYCWGYGGNSQIGNGYTLDQYAPTPVNQSGITYTSITAGTLYFCGLTAAGQTYCWGYNQSGQLGNGTTIDQASPVAVTQGGNTYTQIAGGNVQTCGLTAAGQTYCWGSNAYGQLGNGTTTSSTTPVPVTQSGNTYTSIAGGNGQTCGLTATGQTYCWGLNSSGQLGNGTTTQSTTPVAVTQGGVTYSSISAGNIHTCGLTAAGQAYCWGSNNAYRLGNGTTTDSTTPVIVTQSGVVFTAIQAGGNQTCAIATSKAAYCWGWNGYGAIGDGTTVAARTTPTQTASTPALSKISTTQSSNYACALTSGGQSYCWGDDHWAQLGVFTGTNALAPTAAIIYLDAETVSASATIDPTLTFSISGRSTACNGIGMTGTATATSVNLGHINSTSSVTAGQTFSITDNAGGATVLWVRYLSQLNDGNGHVIADMPGTGSYLQGQSFPATGTAAFGYTYGWLGNSTWMPVTTGTQINWSTLAPGNSDCIVYQAQTAPTTPAGSYSTTVIYTAIPTF